MASADLTINIPKPGDQVQPSPLRPKLTKTVNGKEPPSLDPIPQVEKETEEEFATYREKLLDMLGPDYEGVEKYRLSQDEAKERHWKRWGPYLSERQWVCISHHSEKAYVLIPAQATVREDYSGNGDAWSHFPHAHARSRAYRWGEDGLAGISDNHQRICFALGLWNGVDPILKERLFGVTGHEGNHGEDVKELYWYLDSTPTHSYMK